MTIKELETRHAAAKKLVEAQRARLRAMKDEIDTARSAYESHRKLALTSSDEVQATLVRYDNALAVESEHMTLMNQLMSQIENMRLPGASGAGVNSKAAVI